MPKPTPPKLLTPGEVAEIFGVHPKTLVRWAKEGRIPYQRTLGGMRRYYADEVYRLRDNLRSGAPEEQATGQPPETP